MKQHIYQYNLRPQGEHAQQMITWLNSQSDKMYSLKLLILRAIAQYGQNTDLKSYFTNKIIAGSLDPVDLKNLEPKNKTQTVDNTNSQTNIQTKPTAETQTDTYRQPTQPNNNSQATQPVVKSDTNSSPNSPTHNKSQASSINTDDDNNDSAPNLAFLTQH